MFSTKKITVVVLTSLLFAIACKKEEPAKPSYSPPEGSYNLIYEKIFKTSCALSGCHAKEGDFGHHGLGDEKTYQRLLTEDSHNSQAKAAGLKSVKPGDPAKSFLYAKISWEGSAYQFGQKMPSGGLKLTANQIEFVRQWIAAGAPESGHVADESLLK
ncbi:hypothetical protein [Haliscomenobacter sp.]|uniref:hypothetical protein n=1 Tax=Haliscomenobacter sp. TaxID=2717303 RepID=UPI003BA9E6E8